MKQNVILLSLSQYRIINDKTGALENEGTTARYLLADDLSPCAEATRSVKGRVPAKANLPYADFDRIPTVPGLYEATLDFAIDSKGKAAITATGFRFISEISFNAGGGFGSGFGAQPVPKAAK